jgi:ComF family protein
MAKITPLIPRRPVAHLLAFGHAMLDLVVPPHCATCDQLVSDPGLFCTACFNRVGFVTEPCCETCGVMFAYAGQGGPEGRCPSCRAAPPGFSRARAAFRYDDYARRLILPFKHADRTDLARVLAGHMARVGAPLLREADVLVPVPLHPRRLFQRRYNQAAILAASVAKASGRAVLQDGLIRRRETPPLADKTATERYAALDGAFAVRPRRAREFAGRRVVLVDDVMTSGATANACAAVMKAAGAADVSVLVAARVPDPRLA